MKNFWKNLSNKLFPSEIGADGTARLLSVGFDALRSLSKDSSPWIPHPDPLRTSDHSAKLKDIYGSIKDEGISPEKIIGSIVKDFIPGAPNWRSPRLQYNVCAPVNIAAAAINALAQDINIHNIHTGFAGHCLIAEAAVSRILATLIDLPDEKVRGLFSFGGTASNMYAMKLSINKAAPSAGKTGIPNNLYFLITTEAHFSHQTAADWLGVGIDRVLKIKADPENRSILDDAETKAREILKNGGVVAGFILNGGTTYDHTVDDIVRFSQLRDKLVAEYGLSFRPHIHIDSVIGWVWLMFQGYDFDLNPLGIPDNILTLLKKQFDRVCAIRFADSWGVDFHKALGGCPAPCGLFVSNNRKELLLLSKSHRGICDTHQLGGDWSIDDPSDITLETTRSAGQALAALTSLHVLGRNGFRKFIANQVNATQCFRKEISESDSFLVGNPHSLGFNTMVVIIPPGLTRLHSWEQFLSSVDKNQELLDRANTVVKNFYEWCLGQKEHEVTPLGCSFSRSFRRTLGGKAISALKYYFVSPHMTPNEAHVEVLKLQKQFSKFCVINK